MTVCTIDGRPVLDGPAEWRLASGIAPSVSEFEMTPEDADALVAGPLRPVTLRIEDVRIDYLYVLEKRPAANRATSFVRLADRRFFWQSAYVDMSFNMRRNVGYRRVKAGFQRPEIDPVDPDVRYAPWSVNNDSPWGAKSALLAVWGVVSAIEQETTGSGAPFVVADEVAKIGAETMPLEDVEIHDKGGDALGRILSFIPGGRVTVDADGTVRVYSVASGGERAVMESLGPEQEGGGHAEIVDYSRLRPREVRIFFAPEVEMRFDFEEPGEIGQTVARGTNDPYLENVLPIPDYQLSVSPFGQLAQGSYVPISSALLAWGSVPNFGAITLGIVRRALVPYMDLWAGILRAGLGDAKGSWGARVATLQQHFRRTYRINPRIVNRVQSIRAYRIGTINPVNGTRAPATAFQDYSVVGTQRFFAVRLAAGGSKFAYAENFSGYPAGGILDSSAIAAPAKVSVVDSDQGIVKLDFLMDENRVHEQLLPSAMDNIPTGQLRGGLVAWNSAPIGISDLPTLRANHKCIIVLTVIPAAPNGKGRLLRLTRTPKDVASLLPAALSGGLGNASGPPLEIFIGPGWETARIPWVDAEGKRIKRALGIGEHPAAAGGIDSIADLVMNLGEQKALGTSAASLDAIANSVAAAVYAGYADHYQGTRTVPVTGHARVEGFIREVVHRVLPDGEASSRVSGEERVEPVDMMAFMPTSVRKLVLKLATSGKVLQ